MKGVVIDHRYVVDRSLGCGGETEVFRALDQDGQEVALRVPLDRELAASSADRTRPAPPEGHHPGWVKLLRSGTDPERGAYQVLEFVEGPTLDTLIQRAPLDPDSWQTFVAQSFDAVAALHECGWPHGDLHGRNFIQAASGWKLLDLPFHKLGDRPDRSPVFGSIYTLAPEQFDGAPADRLTDLYSLGCLFYYAACGSYPHPGRSNAEVAIHCLRFPAEPLAGKAPQLTVAWCDGTMELIASKRQDRPQTLAAARRLLGVAVA